MTTLVWDQTQAKRYEAGVDHGVLYLEIGPGIVWNGLLSVVESSEGGEQSSYAADGVTYLTSVGGRDYSANISAFSAPREFGPCVGDLEVIPGFSLTRQHREPFSFSYRTRVGETGYKIHVVYNVTANPSSRSDATTNNTPDPMNLEWEITAIPVNTSFYRPSSHFIIDSTRASPWGLAAAEALLYDSDTPVLPTADELFDILVNTPSPGIITEPISEFI